MAGAHRAGAPAPAVNPRAWDWGVALLLGVFFVWVLVEGGAYGWIGLGLVAVLAGEALAHSRLVRADHDHALRGITLLVTLVLSGVLIWAAPGVMVVLPVLLVLLDVKDDRSSLRLAWERVRGRRERANGPRPQRDPGPSAG